MRDQRGQVEDAVLDEFGEHPDLRNLDAAEALADDQLILSPAMRPTMRAKMATNRFGRKLVRRDQKIVVLNSCETLSARSTEPTDEQGREVRDQTDRRRSEVWVVRSNGCLRRPLRRPIRTASGASLARRRTRSTAPVTRISRGDDERALFGKDGPDDLRPVELHQYSSGSNSRIGFAALEPLTSPSPRRGRWRWRSCRG